MICRIRSSSVNVYFRVCVLLALSIPGALAAQTQPATLSSSELIASHLAEIRSAEQQRLPEEKVGYLWSNLASAYEQAGDFTRAENAFNRSLSLLAKVPSARANYGRAIENLGTLYLQYRRIEEAETCYRRALAIGVELQEPIEIDAVRQHLAEIALAKHDFKQAARESKEVYADIADRRVADRSIEIAALITSIYANCSRHRCEEASREADEAMRLVREFFPGESIALANVVLANGYAQWQSGSIEEADRSILEGLRLLRLHYTDSHPVLLAAMYEYRDYLKSTRRHKEEKLLEQQLAKARENTRGSCSNCSVSVYSLR